MSEVGAETPAGLATRYMLTFAPASGREFWSWKAIVHPLGKVWQEVHLCQIEGRPGSDRIETYKGRLSEQRLARFAELLDWGLAEEAARADAALRVMDTGHVTHAAVGRYDDRTWNMFVVTNQAESPADVLGLNAKGRKTLKDFNAMWLELTRFLPWQPGATAPPVPPCTVKATGLWPTATSSRRR